MSLFFGCDLPQSGLNARALEDDIISDSAELLAGWQCEVVCLGIAVILSHQGWAATVWRGM